MKDAAPQTIYLKDYSQPAFWIPETRLHFILGEDKTIVRSDLLIERNTLIKGSVPLVLDGEKLKLVRVAIDGRELKATEFEATEMMLKIFSMPDRCHLEITVEIDPKNNLSCAGLYKSKNTF